MKPVCKVAKADLRLVTLRRRALGESKLPENTAFLPEIYFHLSSWSFSAKHFLFLSVWFLIHLTLSCYHLGIKWHFSSKDEPVFFFF